MQDTFAFVLGSILTENPETQTLDHYPPGQVRSSHGTRSCQVFTCGERAEVHKTISVLLVACLLAIRSGIPPRLITSPVVKPMYKPMSYCCY